MGKRKSEFNYYKQNDKRHKRLVLEVGMRGFMFTCNSKVKNCIKEAYNILDHYGMKLYDAEKEVPSVDSQEKNDEEEIEDELLKEIESLKEVDGSGSKNKKRFQFIDSGVNNCVFIKTTVPDPVELVNTILEDIYENRKQVSRYILRLLPISVTCKAYITDIKRECEKLFEKNFKCEPTTYSIIYKKRYNDNLLRDEVIESVARLVQDRNVLHKVDLKGAEKTIIIEVIKNICCLSVVPSYFKFKKFNLLELSKKDSENIVTNENEKVAIEKSSNSEDNNKNEKVAVCQSSNLEDTNEKAKISVEQSSNSEDPNGNEKISVEQSSNSEDTNGIKKIGDEQSSNLEDQSEIVK